MSVALFDVWVPSPALARIAPRSAVVSGRDQTGHAVRRCYVEGNVYHAYNLRRYSERVQHAADRAADRVMTVALGSYPLDELTRVATYDVRSRRLVAVLHPRALAAYLDPEPVPSVLTAAEARRRIEAGLRAFGCPAPPLRGALWQRLHAWTGALRDSAAGVLFQCVSVDGDEVEWVAGWHVGAGLTRTMAPALRAALDEG